MRIHSYGQMNLQELDVMREISSIGTGHAATALSGLLQREIRLSIPEVQILNYNDAVSRIGAEEDITGATLVQMRGELNGLMLFLYQFSFAETILRNLMGSCGSSFQALSPLEASALTEVGNIVICSYINAFTRLTRMETTLSVPDSAVNMLGAILTVPMAELDNDSDQLMYCNADFLLEGKRLPSWLLMLPDIPSLNRVMERLCLPVEKEERQMRSVSDR